jgi:hypothetical protein
MDAVAPDRAAPPTLEDVWPLVGLRIRSEHLVLSLPTDADLPGLLDFDRAGMFGLA